MTGAALRLLAVHKRLGRAEALAGVTVEVAAGEVVALLGPNGAGKTTAVAVALGLRRPDRGRALLFGLDPRLPAARRAVGATPQATGFPETLRVHEVVDLVRSHYERPEPAAELLERFGLAGLARRQVGGLSGGEQRRVAVALAFAGRPALVALDEPTTGLDLDARRRVWDELRTFASGGGAVLLTTHQLDEAEALADRVVVLARGRVVASGPLEEIRARAGVTLVRVGVPWLPHVAGALRRTSVDGHTTVYARDGGSVVEQLVELGVPLRDLEVRRATLEEAFLELLGAAR